MKRLILAVFLTLLPCAAQEPANKPEVSHKEAAPEKDMTVWLWANFAILAAGLTWLFRKHGTPFLQSRTESIRKDIVDAEKTQAAANAKVAEVNAKLANLESEIAAIKAQYAQEQAHEAERLRARQQAELARIGNQAQQEIESTSKAARLALQKHAARLALDLAEQKVNARMNPEMQHRLASEFVDSLASQGKS
jgi:F-type H+-transporting ATPase subunit b